MKRVFALLLVMVLCLTAVACTGKVTTTTTAATTKATTKATTAATTTAPTTQATTAAPSIKWSGINSSADITFKAGKLVYLGTKGMDTIFANFLTPLLGRGLLMEYPQAAPNELRHQQVAALVTAGEQLDMFKMEPGLGDWPYLIQQDVLENVDLWLDYSSPALAHLKPVYDSFKIGGKAYVLPMEVSPSMTYVYYNKSLFEDAGLETPYELYLKNEWTMDKMEELTTALTTGDTGDGTPEQIGMYLWDYVPFISASGKDIISIGPDGKFVNNLKDPVISKTMERLQRMFRSKVMTQDLNKAIDLFNKGKMAFWVGADWMTFWFDTIAKTGVIEWVPFPRDTNADKWYVDAFVGGVLVPKSFKNQDAICAFVVEGAQYFAKEENAVRGAEGLSKALYQAEGDKRLYDVYMDQKLNRNKFTFNVSIFKNFNQGAAKAFTDAYWNELMAGTSWSTIAESLTPTINAEVEKLNAGK